MLNNQKYLSGLNLYCISSVISVKEGLFYVLSGYNKNLQGIKLNLIDSEGEIVVSEIINSRNVDGVIHLNENLKYGSYELRLMYGEEILNYVTIIVEKDSVVAHMRLYLLGLRYRILAKKYYEQNMHFEYIKLNEIGLSYYEKIRAFDVAKDGYRSMIYDLIKEKYYDYAERYVDKLIILCKKVKSSDCEGVISMVKHNIKNKSRELMVEEKKDIVYSMVMSWLICDWGDVSRNLSISWIKFFNYLFDYQVGFLNRQKNDYLDLLISMVQSVIESNVMKEKNNEKLLIPVEKFLYEDYDGCFVAYYDDMLRLICLGNYKNWAKISLIVLNRVKEKEKVYERKCAFIGKYLINKSRVVDYVIVSVKNSIDKGAFFLKSIKEILDDYIDYDKGELFIEFYERDYIDIRFFNRNNEMEGCSIMLGEEIMKILKIRIPIYHPISIDNGFERIRKGVYYVYKNKHFFYS